MFFQDKINLFEVYNGLVKAQSLNSSLGLTDAIRHLETKYSDSLRRNEQYREIEGAIVEALTNGGEKRQQIGGI